MRGHDQHEGSGRWRRPPPERTHESSLMSAETTSQVDRLPRRRGAFGAAAIGACILLALALSGCERGPRLDPAQPRPVQAVRASRLDLERSMEIPGSVIGYFQTTLMAQVAGYVKAVHFDKGDFIHQGDVIAEIDVPEVVADRGVHVARVNDA